MLLGGRGRGRDSQDGHYSSVFGAEDPVCVMGRGEGKGNYSQKTELNMKGFIAQSMPR
jgi:hypothetical protein